MEQFLLLLEWMVHHPFLGFGLLAVEYAAIMSLYHRTQLKWLAKALSVPFMIQDWIVNMVFCTLIFLDPPREALVTARMKRYKEKYSTVTYNPLEKWRYWFAVNLCKWLNKFDRGHC